MQAHIQLARTDGTPIVQGGTPAPFKPPTSAVRPFPHIPSSAILMISQPRVKVEIPIHSPETRMCAAMGCVSVLQMDYPHLRCRTCRSLNIPRRPELSTILTPAQLLARDRRYQAVPPLPSRLGPHMPLGRGYPPPPPQYHPPLPFPHSIQGSYAPQISPIPTTVIPAGPSPFYSVPTAVPCKVDPDIDADRALQALLKVRPA